MKNTKKLLVLLAMIIAIVTVTLVVVSAENYVNEKDKYFAWTYKNGVLTITDSSTPYEGEGTANMTIDAALKWNSTADLYPWAKFAPYVQEVIVDTERTYGTTQDYLFARLPQLKKVRIPESWVHVGQNMFYGQAVESVAVGDDPYVEGLWDFSNVAKFHNNYMFEACAQDMAITLKLRSTIFVGDPVNNPDSFVNLSGSLYAFFSRTTDVTLMVEGGSQTASRMDEFKAAVEAGYERGGNYARSLTIENYYPTYTGIVDKNEYYIWELVNTTLTIKDNPANTTETVAEFQFPTASYWPYNPAQTWAAYASKIEEIIVEPTTIQGNRQNYTFAVLPNLKRVRLPESWVFAKSSIFVNMNVESVAIGNNPYEKNVWDFSKVSLFENVTGVADNAAGLFYGCCADMDITFRISETIWVGSETFGNLRGCTNFFFTRTTNLTVEASSTSGMAGMKNTFETTMANLYAADAMVPKSVKVSINYPTVTGVVDKNEYYIWELVGPTLTIKDNPSNTTETVAEFQLPTADYWPYNPAQTWNAYAAQIEEIIVEPTTIQGNRQNFTFAGLANLKRVRLPETWVLAKSSIFMNQNVESVAIGNNAYEKNVWDFSKVNLFENATGIADQVLGLFYGCCADMDITFKISDTIHLGSATFGNLRGCTDFFFTRTTNLTIDANIGSTMAAQKDAFESKMAELYAAGAMVPKSVTVKLPVPPNPANAIKMEGYSVRTEGYNGLRAVFTFDLAFLEELVAEGYTLVGYGGTAALADNEAAAVKKAAYTTEGGFTTILEKTDTEVKFAIAVVNIPDEDLDTALIIKGYAEFTKGGETVTVYTDNTSISYNEAAALG